MKLQRVEWETKESKEKAFNTNTREEMGGERAGLGVNGRVMSICVELFLVCCDTVLCVCFSFHSPFAFQWSDESKEQWPKAFSNC